MTNADDIGPALSARQRSNRRLTLAGFAVGLSAVLILGGVWLASASTPSWPDALSMLLRERRGQAVYDTNCVSCHAGPTGGKIDDYPPRHNANGHTWHHPDCFIRLVTRDGISEPSALALPDSPPMPAFRDRLSPDDIAAVLAYIKTWWTPEQRSAQASFTREMCFDRASRAVRRYRVGRSLAVMRAVPISSSVRVTARGRGSHRSGPG